MQAAVLDTNGMSRVLPSTSYRITEHWYTPKAHNTLQKPWIYRPHANFTAAWRMVQAHV